MLAWLCLVEFDLVSKLLAWLWTFYETQLWDGFAEWPLNPICWDVFPYSLINATMLAWLSVIAPWICVSLLEFPYSLRKSCPARGWQCCWETKEHIGLWLGGTLHQHNWLQGKFYSRISTIAYVIMLFSAIIILALYLLDGMWWTCRYVELCIVPWITAIIGIYVCFSFNAFLLICRVDWLVW